VIDDVHTVYELILIDETIILQILNCQVSNTNLKDFHKMSINIDIKLKRASKIYHEGVGCPSYTVFILVGRLDVEWRLCCRRWSLV
jgi:hypothetical protein